MKRHRVRGFQHGTDVPARSAPLGIGSAIESKEKKLAPALRLTACNHLKRCDCQGVFGRFFAGRISPRLLYEDKAVTASALTRGRPYQARLSFICRRVVNRAGISTGFEIWAFIPDSSDFSTSSTKASAYMAMMGILSASSCARERMRRVASRPSMIGIWISMRMAR